MDKTLTDQRRFTITDAILWRSHEITELLAGCLALDTLFTLKQLERVHDSALTELKAKSFILGMRERLPELETADEDRTVDIILEVAKVKNVLLDYCYWIALPRDPKREVIASIKELQGLTICLNTISNLQGWLQRQDDYYERR